MKHFKCELRYNCATGGGLTPYYGPVLTTYEVKNGESKQLFGRGISEIKVFKKGNPNKILSAIDVERYLYDTGIYLHVFELDAKSLRVVRYVEKSAEEDIFFHGRTLYVTDEAAGLEFGPVRKEEYCSRTQERSGRLVRDEQFHTLGISREEYLAFRSMMVSEFKEAISKEFILREKTPPFTEKELDAMTAKIRTLIRAKDAICAFWEYAKPEEILALQDAFADDFVGNAVKALAGKGDYKALFAAIKQ